MSPSRPLSNESSNTRAHLRLWIRLLKTTRRIESELRERLRLEFQTTLPRFDVMSALHRHESGLKMSQLSKSLMVSNGNVTGIVERLVEEGLVLREVIPQDRRAALARLTEHGRQEFERQARAHHTWLDELLAGVSEADAELVAHLLHTATEHD